MNERRASVLVVDDDVPLRRAVETRLVSDGWDVRAAGSLAEARALLTEEPADVAFLDFHLGDGTGAELLRWASARNLIGAAFCITGMPTCENIVEAMRSGFADVVEKPFDFERLNAILKAWRPRPAHETSAWRDKFAPEILGTSPALMEALRIVENIADTECGVLITGESGTGKELVARALHRGSARAAKPFVALNCAAIPEALIEAELFGHAKGAFTGAVAARGGHILAANGGTLFLDEIGDMPYSAQVKLLRVLQERTVTQIGADRATPIDVRVVAATNRDLEGLIESGQFRADLYFRLCVVGVHLPPMRERGDDVLLLARKLLAEASHRMQRPPASFDDSAVQALLKHAWPGNARELDNMVARAVALNKTTLITAADLQLTRRVPRPAASAPVAPPAAAPAPAAPPAAAAAPPPGSDGDLNLRHAVDSVERVVIRNALEKSGGNRTEAAALLGLNRTTLIEKLKRLAL